MNFLEYQAAVKHRLTYDVSETPFVESMIADLFDKRATVDQAVRMCRCSEHVNPDLAEYVALQRMAKISEEIKSNPK